MKMRSKMQNEKGFTLVELMVVVVILGILVAIAVPVYNSVTEKAEKSAIMANLRTIDGAILQATVTETTAFTWATDQDTILAKYITGWPLTGPKSCSYKVESVTINSKAVDKAIATIPAKVAGYESEATVYLSGDVLVAK